MALTATVSGGTTPYTYIWNTNSVTTATLSGIGAGTYIVSVTDVNGCTGTRTRVVNEPGAIVLNGVTTPATCGLSNGVVSVNITGGAAPFNYQWNSGVTTTSQTGVAAATYTVTVTDVNGCTQMAIMGLLNEAGPGASIFTSLDVNCNGGSDGFALVVSSSGTAPFSYLWSDNQNTESASNLTAGTYQVTVTDINGCTDTTSVIITEPVGITVTTSSNATNCGQNDGSVSATATGGAGSPFTYQWDSNAGSQVGSGASSLNQGNYSVYITDANGCTTSSQVAVGVVDNVVAAFTATQDGDLAPVVVTLDNTSQNATVYNWDFGNGETSTDELPLLTYLEDGTYIITLTAYSDLRQECSDVATLEITVIGTSVIDIPNIFSPNDDGVNDVFNVEAKNIKYLKGIIFNRWGEKIWIWETVQGGWDGRTLSGTLAPDAVYYVKIKAEGKDGIIYDLQKSLTLVR